MSEKIYLGMFIKMFEDPSQPKSLSGFLEFLVYFMFFLGCVVSLKMIMKFFKTVIVQHMFRGCCKSKTHVFDKYGRSGSWALVTGGSDGAGLEMCHQLAA